MLFLHFYALRISFQYLTAVRLMPPSWSLFVQTHAHQSLAGGHSVGSGSTPPISPCKKGADTGAVQLSLSNGLSPGVSSCS